MSGIDRAISNSGKARVLRPPPAARVNRQAPAPRAPRHTNSTAPRVRPYRWWVEKRIRLGFAPLERGVFNPKSSQFPFAFVMPKHSRSVRVQSALIFTASAAVAWALARWITLAVGLVMGDKNAEEE